MKKQFLLKVIFHHTLNYILSYYLLSNNNTKALKVLKKYWNQSPSSALRSSITEVLKENKINEIEFIHRLISKNQNNEESKKLLIDFAIYFNNWSVARDNIKGLIGSNPSREICLFMSEIELGEFNDIQKSEGWKLRANNAGSDITGYVNLQIIHKKIGQHYQTQATLILLNGSSQKC